MDLESDMLKLVSSRRSDTSKQAAALRRSGVRTHRGLLGTCQHYLLLGRETNPASRLTDQHPDICPGSVPRKTDSWLSRCVGLGHGLTGRLNALRAEGDLELLGHSWGEASRRLSRRDACEDQCRENIRGLHFGRL